ncbi:Type VI secretion system baseplate subunit TssG [Candidatus Bealeia paramacronuclearis]|uniref:Type VI secretion system baseplate subunit TssG n=1 Tax=Candidatus Bealeia paramacronuclearis TaxID=1921001 RepID=A0ABZ2C589_9PROT|nr:Type VI secretion system baseplate subunit TssG [Candidatus Bealeia paramacronuclearis]
MANSNRRTDTSLKDQLFQEPYLFEFHRAIQILELMEPDKLPLGLGVNAKDEAVEIKSRAHFDSLRSDIYSLESTTQRHQTPVMEINFMGIAGVQGPLPFPYSEMIIQRQRSGDSSLRDFLDIFNHRLVSILHRIRKQSQISLFSKQPDKIPHATALKAFLGINAKSLQKRMKVPDRALLQYAGLVWRKPHSREGLVQLLMTYFNVPVTIEECVGKRRAIHPEHQTRIGQSGQFQTLGKTAALGTAMWDYQSHFRVILGPLTAKQFARFLPHKSSYQRLSDLIKFYVPTNMDFEIELLIQRKDIFALKLDEQHALGWTSWLGKAKHKNDVPDLRVRLGSQI